MKKLLAMLLVLVMTVSMCSTAFAATIIGFEDGNGYGKTTANSEYYRKARVSADNTVAKYGNYSAKITSGKYYEKTLEDYVVEFQARFDVHTFTIADESYFDAWFYFPENCNVEQLTLTVLDKAGNELISLNIMEAEEYNTWLSFYEYWGSAFDNQDNMGINEIYYLEITGASVDPEQEVVFYMDNLFFGTEAEFETYMQNPEAACPVVDGNGNTTPDNGDTNKPSENKGNETESNDMMVWYIVGGVVALAVVAAVVVVVVAKKKK